MCNCACEDEREERGEKEEFGELVKFTIGGYAAGLLAGAFLDHEALLQPKYGFKTNVYCYAKRNLKAGEKLDGIGGYTCYGLIENCADNIENPGYPICLAEDAILKRDVPKDQKIFMEDLDVDTNRFDLKLYQKAIEYSNGK